MPYADPAKAAESARKRSAAYAKRHPERIKAAYGRHYARVAEYAKQMGLGYREAKKQLADARRTRDGGIEKRNVYGLTASEYRALWDSRGGRCCLCDSSDRRMYVDHRHVDGYEKLPPRERAALVRGLLCAPCNMYLGFVNDDAAELLRRTQLIAVRIGQYLQR